MPSPATIRLIVDDPSSLQYQQLGSQKEGSKLDPIPYISKPAFYALLRAWSYFDLFHFFRKVCERLGELFASS